MWSRLARARLAPVTHAHAWRLHSLARVGEWSGACNCLPPASAPAPVAPRRLVSSLPLPPPSALDSAYSQSSTDSGFSVRSPLSPEVLPPVRLVNRRGEETDTWTAASSSQLGPPGRLMIYASQVAGLVGLNPWTQLHEVFEAVWARSEPEQYQQRIAQVEAELGVRLLTREQEAELLLDQHAHLRAHLDQTVAQAKAMSNDELGAAKTALLSAARSVQGVSDEQTALVADYLVGQLSKAYGTVNEERALKAYERIADLTVIDNNRLFYGREFAVCEIDPTELDTASSAAAAVSASASSHARAGESTRADPSPSASLAEASPPVLRRSIWVGGRVDGFSSVSGHLIEMKNRTRRFMTPLPLYDRCQMECYLQICDVEQGELVERLRVKVDSQQAAQSIADVQRIIRTRMATVDLDAEHQSPPTQQQQPLQTQAADSGLAEVRADSEMEDAEFLSHAAAPPRPLGDDCDPDFLSSSPPAASAPTVSTSKGSANELDSDIDPSFASDTAPAQGYGSEELDSSFMQGGVVASAPADAEEDSSFLSSSSSSSFSSEPRQPLPPLYSDASSPDFEILGTESLDSDIDPQLVGWSGSITHILIREQHVQVQEPRDDVDDGRYLDQAFMAQQAAVQQPADFDMDVGARSARSKKHSAPVVTGVPSVAPSSPSLYIDRLKRSPLRRDNTVWHGRILPPLRQFGQFMTRFLARPMWQRDYLLCRTPEEKHAFLAAAGVMPPKPERKTRKGTSSNNSSNGAAASRSGGANNKAKKQLRDVESDALSMAAITAQANDVRGETKARGNGAKNGSNGSTNGSNTIDPSGDTPADAASVALSRRKRQTKPKATKSNAKGQKMVN